MRPSSCPRIGRPTWYGTPRYYPLRGPLPPLLPLRPKGGATRGAGQPMGHRRAGRCGDRTVARSERDLGSRLSHRVCLMLATYSRQASPPCPQAVPVVADRARRARTCVLRRPRSRGPQPFLVDPRGHLLHGRASDADAGLVPWIPGQWVPGCPLTLQPVPHSQPRVRLPASSPHALPAPSAGGVVRRAGRRRVPVQWAGAPSRRPGARRPGALPCAAADPPMCT